VSAEIESTKDLEVFLLSDGTGETVESILRATLTQFRHGAHIGRREIRVTRYKTIRTRDQIEAILEEANRRRALVLYTAVALEVRAAISERSALLGLQTVDVLGPATDLLSRYLETAPSSKPGLLHEVNEEYFRRIEAMEFAVKQDDGAHPQNLERADIVLVGVSRTSKTPLSIYLSHKGWKVANVPLVKGIQPPASLFDCDQTKIVALIIDPEALAKIRRERLVRMGRDPAGDYASLQNIREEIEWSRELFARNRRWPVFDVTNKALEETASEIERVVARKRTPSWD
jgi:regulator of PEP synthase PpsR (kinase-PPPase family)